MAKDLKDLDKNSMIVFNTICMLFSMHGREKTIYLKSIDDSLDQMDKGDIAFAIEALSEKKLIHVRPAEVLDDRALNILSKRRLKPFSLLADPYQSGIIPESYSPTREGYNLWKSKGKTGSAEEKASNDEWQPVEIKDYKNVAAKIETLAENLRGENAYDLKHKIEVNIIISDCKNFSVNLRDNEGTVPKKSIKNLMVSLKRLSVIANITELSLSLANKIMDIFSNSGG